MKKVTATVMALLMVLCMTVSAVALPEEHNLMLTTAVKEPSWVESAGQKITVNGIVNYVDKDGTTSAVMPSEGICWVRSSHDGMDTWYGISNDGGAFEPGSRFWAKWLSQAENSEEYERLYSMIDSDKERMLSKKSDFLAIGVQNPDGTEYHAFNSLVMFYIQIGDEWDTDDVRAQYIASGRDENFSVILRNIDGPESGTYAVRLLDHFDEFVMVGGGNTLTASTVSQSNVWMVVSFAEFVVIVIAVIALFSEIKKRK